MQQLLGSAERARKHAHVQALRSRAQELERKLEALKMRLAGMERQLKTQARAGTAAPQADESEDSRQVRFSAKGLAARRQKLGLSARQLGALLGVSAQSVYHWEQGKSRPRANQVRAIAALRGLGKRQVAARLTELAS